MQREPASLRQNPRVNRQMACRGTVTGCKCTPGVSCKKHRKCGYLVRLERAMAVHKTAIEKVFGVQLRPLVLDGTCVDATTQAKNWLEAQSVCFVRCGRRERAGGRLSMRLGKRLFPSPCGHVSSGCASDWVRNQTDPTAQHLPDGFVRHLEQVVDRIFPERWDVKSYVGAIAQYPVTTSACRERNRKSFGVRGFLTDQDYLDLVSGEADFPESAFLSRYSEVPTGGKLRPLTVCSGYLAALRPLHKLVYTRLCRQKWLLKGTPTPAKFERAGFRFVHGCLSGDYKSATDNLDLRVSEVLLRRILSRAVVVPRTVKDAALRSLRPRVEVEGLTYTVSKGQMMGSFLSFPLLCLYNYAVTTWALGSNVPMLINGDDLVVETPDPSKWFSVLPPLGLLPEKSKTSYRMGQLEINSTVFVVKNQQLMSCPILRTRSLVNTPDTSLAIGSRAHQFVTELVGFKPLYRKGVEVFFDFNRPVIDKHLHAGMSPRHLGVGPLVAQPALGPTIRLARRMAKCCARVVDAPPLPTPWDHPFPQSRCHGKLTRDLAVARKSYSFLASFSLPRVREEFEAAKDWWSQVPDVTRSDPPSIGDAHFLGKCAAFLLRVCGKRKNGPVLFYGEPMPGHVWFARHFPSERARSVEMVDDRLRLPAFIRWGIARQQWHAGAILPGSGLGEEASVS